MEQDAVELCGPRYGHKDGKAAHRWGKTEGKIGFHGGKVSLARPRVRARDGQEMVLPSWEAAQSEDLLGRWAMNLMLINVSTRRFGRAVRLPEGDIPAPAGAGVSKSAVSRRFVALSAAQTTVDGGGPVEAGRAGDPDRRHSYRGRSGAACRGRH
jgi:hypothetical protein